MYKLPTVKAPRPQKIKPVVSEEMVRLADAGALTINEVRKQHGLPPVAGGDRLFKCKY
ncbi:hypothetical protein [Bacillus vallismortis]|uniref:hypothetical protein n=1 Tax=Bacillus vallismortis TaxID=72361 RepID=UPI00227FD170|nr:hypothetical protein [Bacillus vallismortis]MCY8595361.1 hypothetical protein [Bacillus vallismortis]MCY8890272.1 hypothetical protein [Bacillus spizizenii]MEC0842171.1 hypothetical protein [Bacillus spizizenii]